MTIAESYCDCRKTCDNE